MASRSWLTTLPTTSSGTRSDGPSRGTGRRSSLPAAADADYEITFEVHDILGNDEHVIVLGDAHGTRAGKTLDYRVAEIYHLRDGKIIERWAFSDDTAAITAFFA